MNLAQFTINEMINAYRRAKEEYKKLTQELSDNDQEAQDILHKIEFEEFNESLAFSVAFKLKCLRVARRKTKNQLAQLQTFLDMIDRQHLNNIQQRINIQVNKQENRQYKPHIFSDRLKQEVNT